MAARTCDGSRNNHMSGLIINATSIRRVRTEDIVSYVADAEIAVQGVRFLGVGGYEHRGRDENRQDEKQADQKAGADKACSARRTD